jgi:hypothetical protein
MSSWPQRLRRQTDIVFSEKKSWQAGQVGRESEAGRERCVDFPGNGKCFSVCDTTRLIQALRAACLFVRKTGSHCISTSMARGD